MRLLLVVNPTASSMTPRRRVRIQHALGEAHRLEVAETVRRGHATRLARNAAREGFDAVVVAAGDGTLNEAANGLAGTETALAALPGGSTNVFARTIGVPNSLRPATEQLVASLAARSFRRVGLGAGNGRRFLFHLGTGFDAEVIEQMERHAWLKRRLAHPAFAVTALTTFFRGYDRAHPTYRVEVGAETIGNGFFAVVSNTTPYAFFGLRPLTVTHAAGLDRKLALTLFRHLETRVLLPAALSAMVTGRRLERDGDIVQLADLDAVAFVAESSPFPWQVDGDYLGEVERLEVRYEPACLTVVMPIG
ncbi:MAG TPA: diacylglycerol kinase family protein [Acidimicrobiia bacterium]|nr:diacylglycerol kinase family protein [Acidimicrobiia bacterium]